MPPKKRVTGTGIKNNRIVKKEKYMAPSDFMMIIYNTLACLGWLNVLVRLVLNLVETRDYTGSFNAVHSFVRDVQVSAISEIVFTVSGLTKNSLLTTLIQVGSRLFLVFGVLGPFEQLQVRQSPFYIAMIFAWSLTEVVRYAFYAQKLAGFDAYFIKWARYSLFFVLYPLGAGSELMLIQAALPFAYQLQNGGIIASAIWFISAMYTPGFLNQWNHMKQQRQKHLH